MCFVFHLKRTSHKRTSHKNVFLNQWMLCSEWVPSEWESKQLIKTLNHFDPYNIFLAIATNFPQRLKTGPASHLLKLKCKYSNILRYWQKKPLKCFTLHVMNLKYKNVTFWNKLQEKCFTFSPYSIYFFRCTCTSLEGEYIFSLFSFLGKLFL